MATESRQSFDQTLHIDVGGGRHSEHPVPDLTAVEEPISILLVDDEKKNLTVLESVLASPSYRLVCAESADQALLALIDQEFALLVLDIHMPDMNGFELAHLIKQRKRNAALPIIFLTAYYSEESHVIEGYSTGAVDYLHKPINPQILRSKVAVFAELYRKSRECSFANRILTAEIADRRRAQEELRVLALELERRVEGRTSELTRAINDLKQAEAALREADRRKDEFLATLAHELRNPLAPICNAVQVLQLNEATPPQLDWAKDVIGRQSRQMTRLVDDLLDISRISRGRLALQMQPVKLQDAIQGALETSNPLIQNSRHELTLTIPTDDLIVYGDLTRLGQIFSNLLNNAAKYTEPGGKIALMVERQGQEVCVRVKDNGVGVPPDMLPHVFEMFAQVDRHLDRSQGGLGIGLRLVKFLVEMHGGTIEASSAGAGNGSEFIVRLPLIDRAVSSATDVPAQAPKSPQLNILVVDDNRDNADSLHRLLVLVGHNVRAAYDGPEGIRIAEECRPDVILLDIGMPKMDGHEVCRRIRSCDWGRDIAIIAQTGWGQDQDRRRTQDAGFDYHLVKPITHADLSDVLSKIGEARAARTV